MVRIPTLFLAGLFVVWSGVLGTAQAASVSVTNYVAPGYVIDSDLNRDFIGVEGEYNVGAVLPGVQMKLRVAFSLLDANDQPVELEDGQGQATNEVSVSENFTVSVVNEMRTVGARLRLTDRLIPGADYRVRLIVYTTPDNEVHNNQSAIGQVRQYVHFQDDLLLPNPNNAAVTISGVSFGTTHILTDVPARDHFVVNPTVLIHRYDVSAGPGHLDPVDVRFQVRLVNDVTGQVVPLEQSVFDSQKDVPATAGPDPAVTPLPVTLQVRPSGPLPSAIQHYRVEVSASHKEIGFVDDDEAETAASRLLRMTGELRFGAVSTTVTALANNPTVASVGADFANTTLNIPAGKGVLPQLPDHTFGGVIGVRVYADGHAEFAAGGPLNVNVGNGNAGVVNRVAVQWGAMQLDADGLATDSITVKLPGGFGYANDVTDVVLENELVFAGRLINGSGQPGDDSILFDQPVYVMEESKPFRIWVNGIAWRPALGRFDMVSRGQAEFARLAALNALEAEADLANPAEANRASNDHLFRSVQVPLAATLTVEADENGQSRLNAPLTIGDAAVRPHFPYHAANEAIDYQGGSAVILKDLFDPGASFVSGVATVALGFERGCPPEPGAPAMCDTTGDRGAVILKPNNQQLRITRDGGLQAEGVFDPGTESLRWGKRKENEYAHSHFSLPNKAAYLMPGNALVAGHPQNASLALALSARAGSAVMLLSGMETPADSEDTPERPGTAGYVDGVADYAGINLRAADSAGIQNESFLGNSKTPPFPLSFRGKYYVREGGVSGIHEAQPGFQLNDFDIYGYGFQINNFSLGFLDNANPPGYSRLNGSMVVDPPIEMTFQFANMTINCASQLEEPQVLGAEDRILGPRYWLADLKLKGLRFDPIDAGECNGNRFAKVNVGVPVALNENILLFGTLGLKNDGQLVRQTDNYDGGLASRLKMPANFAMPGPDGETYNFTPLNDAYFNHQANHPGADQGFLNLAGKWRLPFFLSMPVHVHADGNDNAILTYEVMDGAGYLNDAVSDPENRGFANAANSVAAYRSGANYRPHARQGWLGFDRFFDYPVQWNKGGRSFAGSADPLNLFILDIDNRVTYLSPRHAELDFGVEYGAPRLSLGALAYDAVDQGTGFASNLAHAVGDAGRDAILGGIDQLAGTVSDRADFLESLIAAAATAEINALCADLENAAVDGRVDAQIAANLIAGRLSTANGRVGGNLRQLLESTDGVDASGLLGNVLGRVDAAVNGVDSMRNLVDPSRLGLLIRSLVADHAPDFVAVVAGALTEAATAQLVGPELQEVDRQLVAVRDRLTEVRDELTDANSGLPAEITAHLAGPGQAELDGLMMQLQGDAQSFLARVDHDLADLGPDELKNYLNRRLRDRFNGSEIVGVIQHRMRQGVFDAQRSMVAAFDSVLMQVNEEVRAIVASHLADLDDEVNGILGGLSDKIGAGRLRGYAHIEGDALRELRLDGRFRLNVPDEMGLNAYLRIKQLQSDGKGSCGSAEGAVINEIELGADDIAIDWGAGELRASVGTKFWIENRTPIGMGGSIELQGAASLGAVTVTEMAAAMGFANGSHFKQAYFAGMAAMEFDSVALSGGAFFGSTCTLDPIILVDPDVGELLGQPPFSGAYVYGQGRIPIIDFSCAFRISAGVGSGFFYFTEGPTYGGKMFGEVKGEALCAVTIKGDMTLIGVKQGDNFRFRGRGGVGGKVGPCPFCLKFRKSITATYDNGWDVDY